MAKFKVIQHRDAVVRYQVEIEADTAQAALERAKNYDCDWHTGDCHELDHAEMQVQDLKGNELIPAQEVW